MKAARKAKKPGLTEAEKREQVRLALLKKKEYENTALKIVNRLIEEAVEEQWLIASGKSLNESYWDDAVTERSITNLCGYPLCDDRITVKHKGKYKVSLKDNKVYDMEERNKFCSNFCFRASYFFRDQLDSAPLWLREAKDKTFVVFKRQSVKPVNVAVSGKGIVVDFKGSSDHEEKCDINRTESEDESDSDSENNQNQSETVESTVERLIESMMIKDSEETKEESDCDKSKSDLKHTNCDKNAKKNTTDKIPESNSNLTPKECVDSEIKNVRFKEDAIKEKIILPKKKRRVQQTNTTNPVEVVETAVRDWFSIDTYRCVVGDEYLRKTLVERGVSEETIVKTVGDPLLKQDMQAKYRALCRKIDLVEALEDVTEEENEISNTKLPMPNYQDLHKEVETDMLKVSSFLKGKEVYNEDMGKKKEIIVKENEDDEDEPRLPLVDKYAEVALRRRIVVDKLNRSIPDVLDLLEFPLTKVKSSLKELVHSFYLSKDSVMFRPQEWSLISLVVVKLLSVNNEELKSAFKKPSSQKYLNMLLLSYQLPESFLDDLVRSLTGNIDALLGKMANNTAAIFTA